MARNIWNIMDEPVLQYMNVHSETHSKFSNPVTSLDKGVHSETHSKFSNPVTLLEKGVHSETHSEFSNPVTLLEKRVHSETHSKFSNPVTSLGKGVHSETHSKFSNPVTLLEKRVHSETHSKFFNPVTFLEKENTPECNSVFIRKPKHPESRSKISGSGLENLPSSKIVKQMKTEIYASVPLTKRKNKLLPGNEKRNHTHVSTRDLSKPKAQENLPWRGTRFRSCEQLNIGGRTDVQKNLKKSVHSRNSDKKAETGFPDIRVGGILFPVKPVEKFEDLKLTVEILRNITKDSYYPKEVQQYILPLFIFPPIKNVIVSAPKRTGKTFAAVVAVLNNILRYDKEQAAIMCKTCDLVRSTSILMESLGRFHSDVTIYPAIKTKSIKEKKVTEKVVLGTIDKLYDMILESKSVDKSKIKIFVVDELDGIFNEKKHKMIRIIEELPIDCQIIMCSVSLDEDMKRFINANVKRSVFASFPSDHKSINELYIVCSSTNEKISVLKQVKKMSDYDQTLVFCKTKELVSAVGETAAQSGFDVSVYYGKLSPLKKKKVIEDFESGSSTMLITTPGSNISTERLKTIINYDNIITENYQLDAEEYRKRMSLLAERGLMINLIDKKNDYVLNPKEQTVITVNQLEKLL